MQWVFWAVLFAVAIVFQLHSVYYNNRWGMLTSSVRWLRTRIYGRVVLFPAWFWLTWHWFLEPQGFMGNLLDDFAAIGLGIAVAVLVDYDDVLRTFNDALDPDTQE
ncbi:MAG: hypothetical protein LC650_00385 [Actinobacteria bacterium]|nr:hypothetical protein [Actinomycetota bacterium]